jgi:hypothetical protein
MKNSIYSFFFVTFLLASCTGNYQNIPIFGYELGNRKIQKLNLNIRTTDNVVNFEYLQKNDSLKNINLKYDVQKDFIAIALDTFNKIQNTYKLKTVTYEMYQLKKDKNNIRTLVFNADYGLLASLGIDADRAFLEDSISANTKEFLFKELYINLNIE